MKKTTYTASHLANYFIKNIENMTNIKLNKLVYISFGLALAKYGRELFNEPIQAWKLGPVIPSIYHEFKRYGYGYIKHLSYFLDPMTDEKIIFEVEKDDKEAIDALETTKKVYGGMSIRELIGRTHNDNTPWSKVYNPNQYNIEINNRDIKNYYKKLIKE